MYNRNNDMSVIGISSIGDAISKLFGENAESRAVEVQSPFLPYNYYIEETETENSVQIAHVLEIACSGVEKENISVKTKDNVLTVEVFQPKKAEALQTTENDGEEKSLPKTSVQYIHKGLTNKSGKISWMMKNLQNCDIETCKVVNGILLIRIKERPEVDNTINVKVE